MLQKIKAALADLKIDAYTVRERQSENLELYFIRKL